MIWDTINYRNWCPFIFLYRSSWDASWLDQHYKPGNNTKAPSQETWYIVYFSEICNTKDLLIHCTLRQMPLTYCGPVSQYDINSLHQHCHSLCSGTEPAPIHQLCQCWLVTSPMCGQADCIYFIIIALEWLPSSCLLVWHKLHCLHGTRTDITGCTFHKAIKRITGTTQLSNTAATDNVTNHLFMAGVFLWDHWMLYRGKNSYSNLAGRITAP